MDTSITSSPRRNKQKNIYLLGIIVVIILLLTSFFVGRMSVQRTAEQPGGVTLPQAKAKQTINKQFLFSVKNDSGFEITKIKYMIESAEIQQSIIIKGQQATAVNGKTFLVINVKLTNSFNKNIQINSRDYMRLSFNNQSEPIAPDLHNDPIEVDAISAKETRLGFAVDTNAKNVVLHVGEIDGKKTDIPLTIFSK